MDIDSNEAISTTTTSAQKPKEPEDLRYEVELTRAIKENHGQPILDAKWCPYKDGEAYFATVGANQVNIYDCEVRGNFISTLFNYRNWHLPTMRTKNIVWKENLEKHHPEEWAKKSFSAVCWLRRFRDFWLCAADNEGQLHILSMVFAKCTRIIKLEGGHSAVELEAHPKWPNIVCVIDTQSKCRFLNVLNEEVILELDAKVTLLRFSPSNDDKFCVALSNGSLREYQQSVEEGDEKEGTSKRLTVTALRTYKTEERAKDIADLQYRGGGTSSVIVGNEDGEFRMVDMALCPPRVEHQWKAVGPIEKGNVCRFEVNAKGDCVVYGNGAHQVQIYDVEHKRYVRRVDAGRGRKLPFSFATFCRNHPHSVLLVCDNIVMKFDPFELVEEYFPSTADFAVQTRNGGQKCFKEVRVIKYAADQAGAEQ